MVDYRKLNSLKRKCRQWERTFRVAGKVLLSYLVVLLLMHGHLVCSQWKAWIDLWDHISKLGGGKQKPG